MIQLKHKVLVTDPCYDLDTYCTCILNNVLPGNYKTHIHTQEVRDWGNRVTCLEAIHEKFIEENLQYTLHFTKIGVDSGQCGIFDFLSVYKDIGGGYEDRQTGKYIHKPMYLRICDMTDLEELGGEFDNIGVVSRTGFGDGMYYLYVAYDEDNHIVGIKVKFIDEQVIEELVGEE